MARNNVMKETDFRMKIIKDVIDETFKSCKDDDEKMDFAAFMHFAVIEYAKQYVNLDITCKELTERATVYNVHIMERLQED